MKSGKDHKDSVNLTGNNKKNFAPDFSAKDIDGKNIELSQFRGEKNVLLVFNRGFS